MEVLGFHEMPTTSPWPRVFWITTGPLSSFPIHCAGYHYSGSTRTVMDRVISTYSASVGGILQGRQVTSRISSKERQSKRALLVGVQELRYAPEEISQIQKLCTEMHLNAAILEPSRGAVLDSLPECEVFHFAGHGMSHPLDPSKSSLKMSDGPLSVQDLFNIKLHDRAPFLAYLSACSTGRSEDEDLVDEGLHLIGACQMAGFRNVVGTLRRVDDSVCVHVANMTYKWIKDSSLSNESVGEGLHHATRMLRDQWVTANEQGDEMRGALGRQEANSHSQSLFQSTAAEAENGTMKEGRDIISCSDEPISWAPFVHFGS
jgi:CHAT domain-containing protein